MIYIDTIWVEDRFLVFNGIAFLKQAHLHKRDVKMRLLFKESSKNTVYFLPCEISQNELVTQSIDNVNNLVNAFNFNAKVRISDLNRMVLQHEKLTFHSEVAAYGKLLASEPLSLFLSQSIDEQQTKLKQLQSDCIDAEFVHYLGSLALEKVNQVKEKLLLIGMHNSSESVEFHLIAVDGAVNSIMGLNACLINSKTGLKQQLEALIDGNQLIVRCMYSQLFDETHGHNDELTLALFSNDSSEDRLLVLNKSFALQRIESGPYHTKLPAINRVVKFKILHSRMVSKSNHKPSINIKNIKWKDGELKIEGNAYIPKTDASKPPKIELLLKGREKSNLDRILTWPVENIINRRITKNRAADRVNYDWSAYRVKVDLEALCGDENFVDGYWDLFLSIEHSKHRAVARLGRPTGKVTKKKFWYEFFPHFCDEKSIIPYFTPGNAVSILKRKKDEFETVNLKWKEMLAYYLYPIFKFFLPKNIWLTWETNASTAQDNSYFLFNYFRKVGGNINLYYVIKDNSPDLKKFDGDKSNVLSFLSFKHLLYIQAAKGLVSSQTRQHGYIFRAPKTRVLRCLESKPFVFLQHGVTAFKAIRGGQPALNAKSSQNIDTFVVTSKFEQTIVTDILGYDVKNVPVLGFTRFDNLKLLTDPRRQILLIPTWRDWLEFEADVTESEFFKFYQSLLSNQALIKFLETENVVLKFYMHIKLADCLSNFVFGSNFIKPVFVGEEDVSTLIKESALMITDHSSVAWDFFYQKKPVIFAHFDDHRFPPLNDNYKNEEFLFGDKCDSVTKVVSAVVQSGSNNFQLNEIFSRKHSEYFPEFEGSHCHATLDYLNKFD
ncbi:CDP-glycerol glycerophosphotransferase family protein [Catenovulum sp. SX2]|uniref:CDP-glycerol glycerophosphotransferase family protein n=1 Tax=Catenovulum sp. SX2 TaxID=3398614 RepID=UPI003F8763A6